MAHFGSKIAKVTILEVFTLVIQSLSKSHTWCNNIIVASSVFLIRDWKLKFCVRNSIFGSFWGQNVGPGLVKNGKNVIFISHLTPNSVFPKKEVLKEP